jgi:hypothetical protein
MGSSGRRQSAGTFLRPAEGGEKVPEGRMRAAWSRGKLALTGVVSDAFRRTLCAGPHPALRATFSRVREKGRTSNPYNAKLTPHPHDEAAFGLRIWND